MTPIIDPTDRNGPQERPLLATQRLRQRATRTAQIAQQASVAAAPALPLAPGDGAFNAAAAAKLSQWKDR